MKKIIYTRDECSYWFSVYASLTKKTRDHVNSTNFIEITEWKSIKEWIEGEVYGEIFIRRINNLIDNYGPFYKNKYDYMDICAYSIESCMYLLQILTDRAYWFDFDGKSTILFYLENGRFPNDFDD